MRTKATLTLVLAAAMCLAAGGCGNGAFNPDLAVQKRELGEIRDCCVHFEKENERPPKELAELENYEAAHEAGIRALREGRYVMIFGVKDKGAGTLLAYEKDTPTQGGAVIMANGTVKTMTVAQFARAKPSP